jgi:hypothetical protein
MKLLDLLSRNVALTVLAVAAVGCTTGQFYSRNGAGYPRVAVQAIQIDDGEARAVLDAGGYVIGNVQAKGWTARDTSDDVDLKAAQIAAASGGTHVVVRERSAMVHESTQPGTADTACTREDGVRECQTTYTEPQTTTWTSPLARYDVLRVEPQNWARLPPQLRPVWVR